MTRPINEMSSWGHSVHHSRISEADWAATREMTQLQTQLMRNKEDYLADSSREVGRRIDDEHHELFVVCAPFDALNQQFQHLVPDLIAVHDVATDSSRRLVAGVAAATGKKVQKLLIRRQGHGVPLATIEFAELPGANGKTLRLYSTLVDTDSRQREEIALALLAHSRLAVIIIGDLPVHALEDVLDPISNQINLGPWPNRNLLLIPLGSSSRYTGLADRFGGRSGVTVRLTPQAIKPADAWAYVSKAWDQMRLGEQDSGFAPAPSTVSHPPSLLQVPSPQSAAAPGPAPLPMRPMPAIGAARDAETPWTRYIHDCAEIKGMVSCAIFEQSTQKTLAHAGARPGPATLASNGVPLIDAMAAAGREMKLSGGRPDAAISFAGHHLLVHPIPGQTDLVLQAVLDSRTANLTLARMRIARLDEALND